MKNQSPCSSRSVGRWFQCRAFGEDAGGAVWVWLNAQGLLWRQSQDLWQWRYSSADFVQLLEEGLGPNTVHVAASWQQFVPTFGSLKLIWVCMHILHSLWSAEIQSSGSFMWCEQIYLPTAVIGKYLFFAHLQFSWKLSLRQTEGCSTSSF